MDDCNQQDVGNDCALFTTEYMPGNASNGTLYTQDNLPDIRSICVGGLPKIYLYIFGVGPIS